MKKDLLYALIVIVVIAGICFGVAQIRPEFTPTTSHPYSLEATKSTAPVSRVAPAAGKVVMRVNGEEVTEQEFQTFVSGMPDQAKRVAEMPQGRRLIAEQVASLVALAQEGRRMGIESDGEVRNRLSTDQINVVAMAALKKLVTPSDAALRDEYDKRKNSFDTIDLKHILIAYEGGQVPPRGGAPLPVPMAMQKAQQIETQLAAGADFALMARAQSDDTSSAQNGGEIGAVPRESLPPDVAAEVFALKTGQVSKPLRTPFGIHIFKAGERKAPSFEEMKPQLEAEAQQKSAGDAVQRIRSSAKIDLDPAFFGPEPPKRPQELKRPQAPMPSPKNPS
ncbi:MAG TPA: peptidylprolyl isomerase [Thermoanaerobaculia bacterium]|nr:peptidylprolyl isomerase [Thermoanaerobaculia bacterium]